LLECYKFFSESNLYNFFADYAGNLSAKERSAVEIFLRCKTLSCSGGPLFSAERAFDYKPFRLITLISHAAYNWDEFVAGSAPLSGTGQLDFTPRKPLSAGKSKLDKPVLDGGYSTDYSEVGGLVDLDRPAGLKEGGELKGESFETRSLLYNLSISFYTVFGVYYNIFYYPVTRIFESHPRMRELASGASAFLRSHVTRNPKDLLWLTEFTAIYYTCIYLRITEPMVRFIAGRLGVSYN